jgi:hypothetical protein
LFELIQTKSRIRSVTINETSFVKETEQQENLRNTIQKAKLTGTSLLATGEKFAFSDILENMRQNELPNNSLSPGGSSIKNNKGTLQRKNTATKALKLFIL